jgi:hypothetical protein
MRTNSARTNSNVASDASYLTIQISRAQHILLAAMAMSVIAGVSIALGMLAFSAKAENGDTPPNLGVQSSCAQTPDDTSARGGASSDNATSPENAGDAGTLEAGDAPSASSVASDAASGADPTSATPDALTPGPCSQANAPPVDATSDSNGSEDDPGAHVIAAAEPDPASSAHAGDGSATIQVASAPIQPFDSPIAPMSSAQLNYSGDFWTRSPYQNCSADTCEVQIVTSTGALNHTAVGNSYQVRPTFFVKLSAFDRVTQALMVGTCAKEARACVQFGTAMFDVIGIQKDSTQVGTCATAYTTPGYSDNSSAQCPANSAQLLLSADSTLRPAAVTFSGELPGNRWTASDYTASQLDSAMNSFYTSVSALKMSNHANYPTLASSIIARALIGGAPQSDPNSNTVAGATPGSRYFFPLSAQEAASVINFSLPGPEVLLNNPDASVASPYGLSCTTTAGPNYDTTNPGNVVQQNNVYIINGMLFEAVGYNDGVHRCGAGIDKAEMDNLGESGVATLLLKDDAQYNSYLFGAFSAQTIGETSTEYAYSLVREKLENFAISTGTKDFPGVISRNLSGRLDDAVPPTEFGVSCSATALPFAPGNFAGSKCFNNIVGPDVNDQTFWPLSEYEVTRIPTYSRIISSTTSSSTGKTWWLRTPLNIYGEDSHRPSMTNATYNASRFMRYVSNAGAIGNLAPNTTSGITRPSLLFRLSDLPSVKQDTSKLINFVHVTADKPDFMYFNSPVSAVNRKITYRVDFNVSQHYQASGILYIPLQSLTTLGHPYFNTPSEPLLNCSTMELDFTGAGGGFLDTSPATSIFRDYHSSACGSVPGNEPNGQQFLAIYLKDQGDNGLSIVGRYSFSISFMSNPAYDNKIPSYTPLMQLNVQAYIDPSYGYPTIATRPSGQVLSGSARTVTVALSSDNYAGHSKYDQTFIQPTASLQMATPQDVTTWKGGPIKYNTLRSFFAYAPRYENLQTSANTTSPERTCHSTYLPAGSAIIAPNGNKALNIGDITHVSVTYGTSGPFKDSDGNPNKNFDKYSYCLTETEATTANASQTTNSYANTSASYLGFTFQPPDVSPGQRVEMRYCDESRYVNQAPITSCYIQYFTRVPEVWKFDTSPALTGSTRYYYHRWPGDEAMPEVNITGREVYPIAAQYQDTRMKNYGNLPVEGYSLLATQEYSPEDFTYAKPAFTNGAQLNNHARVALGDKIVARMWRGFDETTGELAEWNKVKLTVHIANLMSNTMETPVTIDIDPDTVPGTGYTLNSGCLATSWNCYVNVPLSTITSAFSPGMIIQAYELTPMGTDGASPGELSPMNALSMAYYITNRFPGDNRAGVWPDGTPFHVSDYTTGNGCYFDGPMSASDGRLRENDCRAQVVSSLRYIDHLDSDTPKVIETCSKISCTANDREYTMYKMDENTHTLNGGEMLGYGLDWNASGKVIVPGNQLESKLGFGINGGYNPLYEYVNPVIGMKVPHGLQMQGFTGTRDGYAPDDGTTWTTPGGANVSQPYWQNQINMYPSEYPTSGNNSHFPMRIELVSHDDYYDYYTFTILNTNGYGASRTYAPTGDLYTQKYITAKMHQSANQVRWGVTAGVKWTATPFTYPGKFPGEWNAAKSSYALPFTQEDKATYVDAKTRVGTIGNTPAVPLEQFDKYGFSAAALNFSAASGQTTHFIVNPSAQLSATSHFSVSSVDGGNFHAGDGSVVGAQRGDTVKVKFTFTNNGNTPYTDFKLYFAKPFDGDTLGSTGDIHFNRVTDENGDPMPNSITMYNASTSEDATPAFGQVAIPTGKVLNLQTENFWTHPSWQSTAPPNYSWVKMDIFGILVPGASYDVVLEYTMPADTGSTIISQIAYSANQPMLGVAFNANTSVFGISTDSIPVRYDHNKPADYPDAAFPGQNVTDIHSFDEDGEYDVFPNEVFASNCEPKVAGCYKVDPRVPKLKGYQFVDYEMVIYNSSLGWNDGGGTPTYPHLMPGDTVNFSFSQVGKYAKLVAKWKRAEANVYFNAGNVASTTLSPIRPGISATPAAGTIAIGSKSVDTSLLTDAQYASAKVEFGKSYLYPLTSLNHGTYQCDLNALNTTDLQHNVCRNGYELEGFYTSIEQANSGGSSGKVTFDDWATYAGAGAADFPGQANGSYCAGVVTPWCPSGAKQSLTLYARWVPRQVVLNFDNNGGTGTVVAIDLDFAGNYTKAALPGPSDRGFSGFTWPSRTGYVLNGWARTPACTSLENTFQVDWDPENTFYACWVTEPKIIFNSNGASSGSYGGPDYKPADQVCLRNVACTLPNPTRAQMQKDFYTFTTWNTAADGSGTTYSGGYPYMNIAPEGGSITLYAQWRGNIITFDFNKNYATGPDIDDIECRLFEPCNFPTPNYSLPSGRSYLNGGTWGTGNGGTTLDIEGTNDALFGYTIAGGTQVTFTPTIIDLIAAEHTGTPLENLRANLAGGHVGVELFSLWSRLPDGKMAASAVPNAPDTIAAEYVKHVGANDSSTLKGIEVRCSNSVALAEVNQGNVANYQASTAELIAGGAWGDGTWPATSTSGTYFEVAGVEPGQSIGEATAVSFPSWFHQFNWQKDSVRAVGDWRCQYRVIDRSVPIAGAGQDITDADYLPWSEPSNPITFYKFTTNSATVDSATSKMANFEVGQGAAKKSTFSASTASGYPANNTLMLSGGVVYNLYMTCQVGYNRAQTTFTPAYGGLTSYNAEHPTNLVFDLSGRAQPSADVTQSGTCIDIFPPDFTISHSVPQINTPTARVNIDSIYDDVDGDDATKFQWRASLMVSGGGDGTAIAGWTSYDSASSFDVSWASNAANMREYDQKINIYVKDSSGATKKIVYTPWVRWALYQLEPLHPWTVADIAPAESSNWPKQNYFALSSGGLNQMPNNSNPEFKPSGKVDPTWKMYSNSTWSHNIVNQQEEEWHPGPSECEDNAPVGVLNVTYNCSFYVEPDLDSAKLIKVRLYNNSGASDGADYGDVSSRAVSDSSTLDLSPDLYREVEVFPGYTINRTPANTSSLSVTDGAKYYTSPGANFGGAGTPFSSANIWSKALDAALASTGTGVYPNHFTFNAYLGWTPSQMLINYSGGAGATGTKPSSHTCIYTDATCLILGRNTLTKVGHYFNGWKVVASGDPSLIGNTYTAGTNVKSLILDNPVTLTLEAIWTPTKLVITMRNNHPSDGVTTNSGISITLEYGKNFQIIQMPSEAYPEDMAGFYYGERGSGTLPEPRVGVPLGYMKDIYQANTPPRGVDSAKFLDTRVYSPTEVLAVFGNKSLNQVIEGLSANTVQSSWAQNLYEQVYPYTLTTTYIDYYQGSATPDVVCNFGRLCRLSNVTNFVRDGYILWGWKDTVTGDTYPLNSVYGNYDNNGLTNAAHASRQFEAVWMPDAPAGTLTVSKGNTVQQIESGKAAVNVRLDWVKPAGVQDSDIKGYQVTCKKNLNDALLFTNDVSASQTYLYTPVIYDLEVDGTYRAQIDCAYRIKVGPGASDYTSWSSYTSFYMQRTMVGIYDSAVDNTVAGSATIDTVPMSATQTIFWPLFDTNYSAGVTCKPGYTVGAWGHNSSYIVRETAASGVNPINFKTRAGSGAAQPYGTPALVSNCQDLTPPSATASIVQPTSDAPGATLGINASDAVSAAANITWKVGLSDSGDDVCAERPATASTCSYNLPNTSVDYTLHFTVSDEAGNETKITKLLRMYKREYSGNTDHAGNTRTLPAIQYEIWADSVSALTSPDNVPVRAFTPLPLDSPWDSAFKVYCSDGSTCAPGNGSLPAQNKHILSDEVFSAVWIQNAVEVVSAHLYGADGVTPATPADTTQIFKVSLKWSNFGTAANQMLRTGQPLGTYVMDILQNVEGQTPPITQIACGNWSTLNAEGEASCQTTLSGGNVIRFAGTFSSTSRFEQATPNTESIPDADVFLSTDLSSANDDVVVGALPIKVVINTTGVTGRHTMDQVQFTASVRYDNGTANGLGFSSTTGKRLKGTLAYSVLFEAPLGTSRSIVGSCNIDSQIDSLQACTFWAPAGASGMSNPERLAPASGDYEATVTFTPDTADGRIVNTASSVAEYSINKYAPTLTLSAPQDASGAPLGSVSSASEMYVTATLKIQTDGISRTMDPVSTANALGGALFGGGLCLEVDDAAANSNCKMIVYREMNVGTGVDIGYDLWSYRIKVGYLSGGAHTIHAKYYGDILFMSSPIAGDGATMPGGPNIDVERKPVIYDVYGTAHITPLDTSTPVIIYVGDTAPIAQRIPSGVVQVEVRKNFDDFAVVSTATNCNTTHAIVDYVITTDGYGQVLCNLPKLEEGEYSFYAKFTGDASEDIIANQSTLTRIHTFRVSYLSSVVNLAYGATHGTLTMNETSPGLGNGDFSEHGDGEAWLDSLHFGGNLPKVGDAAGTSVIQGTISAWTCRPSGDPAFCTGNATTDADRIGPGGAVVYANPFQGRVRVVISDDSATSAPFLFFVPVDQALGHFSIPLPKFTHAGSYSVGVMYVDDPDIGTGEFSFANHELFHINVSAINETAYGFMILPGHFGQSVSCEANGYENSSASGTWPDMTYEPSHIQTNGVSECNTQKQIYSVRFHAEHTPEGVSLQDMPLSLQVKQKVNSDPTNAANTLLADSNDEPAQYSTRPLSEYLTPLQGHHLTHFDSNADHYMPGNYDSHWSYEFVIASSLPVGDYWVCGTLGDGLNFEGKSATCFTLEVVENELGPEPGSVCDDSPGNTNYDAAKCVEDPTGGKLTITPQSSLKNYLTSTLSGENPTIVGAKVNFTGTPQSLEAVVEDGVMSWTIYNADDDSQVATGDFTKHANKRNFNATLPMIPVAGDYYLRVELSGDSSIKDESFDFPFSVWRENSEVKFTTCNDAFVPGDCSGSILSMEHGHGAPTVYLPTNDNYPSGGQIVPFILGSQAFKASASTSCDVLEDADPVYSCYAPTPELDAPSLSFAVYESDGTTLATGIDGNSLADVEQIDFSLEDAEFYMMNDDLSENNLPLDTSSASVLRHGQVLAGVKLPEFEKPGVYVMKLCWAGDPGLNPATCVTRSFTVRPDKERPEVEVTSSMYSWVNDSTVTAHESTGFCSFYDEDVATDELVLTSRDETCLPADARTDQGYVSSSVSKGDRIKLHFDFAPNISTELPSGFVRVNILRAGHPGAEDGSICLNGQVLASLGGCHIDALLDANAESDLTLPKFSRFGEYELTWEFNASSTSKFDSAHGLLSENDVWSKYPVEKARVYGGEGVEVKANFQKVTTVEGDLTASVWITTHKSVDSMFGCTDAQPDPTPSHDPADHVGCVELTLSGSNLAPLSGSTGSATHTYKINVHPSNTYPGTAGLTSPALQRYRGDVTIPKEDIGGVTNIGEWTISARLLESDGLHETDKLKYFSFEGETPACTSLETCDTTGPGDTTFETEVHSSVHYALPTLSGVDGAFAGRIVKTESGIVVPQTGITSAPTQRDVLAYTGLHGYNVECWVDISSQVLNPSGGIDMPMLWAALDGPTPYNCASNAVDFASFDVIDEAYVFMPIFHTYPGFCAKEFEVVDGVNEAECEDGGGNWYEEDQGTSGSQLLLHFWTPLNPEVNPNLAYDEAGTPLGLLAGFYQTGFVIGDGWMCKDAHVGVHAQCTATTEASHAESTLSTNVNPSLHALNMSFYEAASRSGLPEAPVAPEGVALAPQEFSPRATTQPLYASSLAPQAVTPDGSLDLDCNDTHDAWASGQSASSPDGTCNIAQSVDVNTTGRFQGEVGLSSDIKAGKHIFVAEGVGEPYTSGVAVYALLPQGPLNPCPTNPSIETSDPACTAGGGGSGSGGGSGDEAGNTGGASFHCEGAEASNENDCRLAGGRWVASTGAAAWQIVLLIALVLGVALLARLSVERVSRRRRRAFLDRS